jgi:hypothetical protein
METKTVYDHQATTIKDSERNPAHGRQKQIQPQNDGKY